MHPTLQELKKRDHAETFQKSAALCDSKILVSQAERDRLEVVAKRSKRIAALSGSGKVKSDKEQKTRLAMVRKSKRAASQIERSQLETSSTANRHSAHMEILKADTRRPTPHAADLEVLRQVCHLG